MAYRHLPWGRGLVRFSVHSHDGMTEVERLAALATNRSLPTCYAGLRRSGLVRGTGEKVRAIATAPSPTAREARCIPA